MKGYFITKRRSKETVSTSLKEMIMNYFNVNKVIHNNYELSLSKLESRVIEDKKEYLIHIRGVVYAKSLIEEEYTKKGFRYFHIILKEFGSDTHILLEEEGVSLHELTRNISSIITGTYPKVDLYTFIEKNFLKKIGRKGKQRFSFIMFPY